MGLFYIRHHFQSLIRSNSFGGEVFAFFLILGLFASSGFLTYAQLDGYVVWLSQLFDRSTSDYALFLVCYLFVDLAVKLVFRRPFPKLKYYVFLGDRSHAIASQYLFTSLFGIIPFVLVISLLLIGAKALEWLGPAAFLVLMLWWLTNHFLALIAQFGPKWVKGLVLGIVLLSLLVLYLVPGVELTVAMLDPVVVSILFIALVGLAYRAVRSTIERREAYHAHSESGLLENLPVFHFKNPIFQLEWALIARNKRTRSNLLLGLVSVLILPFLLKGEAPSMLVTLIYFITTGFFIIQHGAYSLGWEGSYFDFLICNISPECFVRTRYAFYIATCIVGLLLASISTLMMGHNWLSLFAVFLYNVGVTIPLVLYRSTKNETKIILTENSFMNYNGMMTGPIFVTSFMVVLFPMILFGIAQGFLADHAILALGAVGIIGLGFFRPISNKIAAIYQRRKYHLSQSFKA